MVTFHVSEVYEVYVLQIGKMFDIRICVLGDRRHDRHLKNALLLQKERLKVKSCYFIYQKVPNDMKEMLKYVSHNLFMQL